MSLIDLTEHVSFEKSVSIGDNVSIGANSVVTKDFEDNVAIAGIPASVISHKTTLDLGMFPNGFLDDKYSTKATTK